jgi:hypothetical protein
MVPVPWVFEGSNLSIGFDTRVRIKGRIKIDGIDGFVFDVFPQDIQIVPVKD